jgi:hypothetical protein
MTAIAFLVAGCLFCIILLQAVMSKGAEKHCWREGYRHGYRYGREPWAEQWQHVAPFVDDEDP